MDTSFIRASLKKHDELLTKMEEYAKENRVPIALPEVAALLEVLSKSIRPKKILEVGTAIGYSAILLSKGLTEDGHLTTVERSDKMIFKAKENFKKAGISDKITVLGGDACEVLPLMNDEFDIIFLDASKSHYLELLPHCIRMLKQGGLLISDNVLFRGMIADDGLVPRRDRTIVTKMRNFINTICSSDELTSTVLDVGDGVSLSYKN